ncbi:MAG: RNA methyltransferase [Actinobacteria bacterium]|nr:RNA methyltransferase [Actinomycetota bacterium]
MTDALSARHAEVKRLRALLRDAKAREVEDAFVVEGPRAVEAALDRGADLESVYLGLGASTAFATLVARLDGAGIRRADLKEGVLEKIGTTRTPQPMLAVARGTVRPFTAAAGSSIMVVAIGVSDPGNLGTIIRSAEAAGADAVVACGDAVDPRNPKVVRSSAGALFGVPVMDATDPIPVLEALRTDGRRIIGAAAEGGAAPHSVDLVSRCALIVGNEARGLPNEVASRLDQLVSIPMAAAAESLNVAMATTVLLFEAARQRHLSLAER